MLRIEKYFKRENKFIYGESVFEKLINRNFEIINKDSESLMVKYFLIKTLTGNIKKFYLSIKIDTINAAVL